MHLLTLSPLTEISHGLSYAACNLASLISIERASGPSNSEILTKWLTPTSFKLMMGSGLGLLHNTLDIANYGKLKLWSLGSQKSCKGVCTVHESGIK